MKIIFYSAATAIVMLTTGCSSDDNNIEASTSTVVNFQNSITINNKALYPEGIDYDTTNNVFVVGSFYKGEVGRVNPETGVYTTFITDTDLIAVTGVFTDELRNRLIVATADAGASLKTTPETIGKIAKVAIYNLTTGVREALIPLENLTTGNGSFANDIAVDNDGNIFVTNSFGNADIFKIDTNNNASLYITIPGNRTDIGTFGLNGIVYEPISGKLITGHTDTGRIFIINESQGIPTSQRMVFTDIPGVDGLEINDDGKLIAVSNANRTITIDNINITGNSTLTITPEKRIRAEDNSFTTTAVSVANKGTFVLYSNLLKLFNGDKDFSKFKIVKISSLE